MEKLKGLDLEDKLVLDAGTGACNMTLFLEEWGAEVVSIDNRRDRQLDCKGKTKDVQFINSDLSEMGFIRDESFDLIVCNFLVSALSENRTLIIPAVFREMHRVLKYDGILVIIDYYPFDEELCPGSCHDAHVELMRLEKGTAELLGMGHLEEYPPDVIYDELRSVGFEETDLSILLEEVPWPDDLIREHEEGLREDIEKLDEGYMRDALMEKLDSIIEITEIEKIESGSIYELRAKK